jgi:hypothetical protein
VQAAARDLLRQAAATDLYQSALFPHGVNQLSLTVRAGDIEVSLELSGPDHSHDVEDLEIDPDDLAWDEDDDAT